MYLSCPQGLMRGPGMDLGWTRLGPDRRKYRLVSHAPSLEFSIPVTEEPEVASETREETLLNRKISLLGTTLTSAFSLAGQAWEGLRSIESWSSTNGMNRQSGFLPSTANHTYRNRYPRHPTDNNKNHLTRKLAMPFSSKHFSHSSRSP